jgi:2-methylisocitrate lyase-like PEP mutase family enzyme
MPKRCGHFEGKAIIPAEEMVSKIKAAQHAREEKDFLIIARTDALAILGLKEALRRARMYADCGADMLFVEAPQSTEDLERISSELKGFPLLINMVEGGKTPTFDFAFLRGKGFKIVLYPTTSVRMVMKTFQDFGRHLREKMNTKELEPRTVSFEKRNRILGLAEINELEKQFAG